MVGLAVCQTGARIKDKGEERTDTEGSYSATLTSNDVLAWKVLECSLCCDAMPCDIHFEAFFELHVSWSWHLYYTIPRLRHDRLFPDVEDLHSILSYEVGSKHRHHSVILSSWSTEAWAC